MLPADYLLLALVAYLMLGAILAGARSYSSLDIAFLYAILEHVFFLPRY